MAQHVTQELHRHGAVVRIFASTQVSDHDNPWQRLAPALSTGSGVVIGPGRVLTGAHVVADATFTQVQKVTEPDKYTAEVEACCHDCDLALLRVSDPAFMADLTPATIGSLPNLRDRVSVAGFPIGGDEISVTDGVVSRVEIQRYSHSQRDLLAVTVDAAINAGNSGGPVFLNDEVVGIAFQTLDNAENIGEMVPAPLLKRFLGGIDAGRRLEVPSLGVESQPLENPTLRASLGLARGQSGIRVRAIAAGGAADGLLEPDDVITAIAGHAIANNGTIRYANRFRVGCGVVMGEHFIGDTLAVHVMRNGRPLALQAVLADERALVPRSRYGQAPHYFVYAGLVFVPLTRDFLGTWGEEWWHVAPTELLFHYYYGLPTYDREERVVLSRVLADEVNVGYEALPVETVEAVNGTTPRNLAHFVHLVDSSQGRVQITMSSHNVVVLDVEAAREANRRILARYHVPTDRYLEDVPAR